jgi:crotonobetainyl-CoA:carnitine CoA-transferase CaiB-like acyl-CoA transferase
MIADPAPPLAGIKVLDLSAVYSPMAAALLADQGAGGHQGREPRRRHLPAHRPAKGDIRAPSSP